MNFGVGDLLRPSHGLPIHTLPEFCARVKVMSLDSRLESLISGHFLGEVLMKFPLTPSCSAVTLVYFVVVPEFMNPSVISNICIVFAAGFTLHEGKGSNSFVRANYPRIPLHLGWVEHLFSHSWEEALG